MKEVLKLEDIIDVEQFQVFQDDISKATEMALLTVDYKGVPITLHSLCKPYCKIMRKDATHKDLCQKCDSRGGLEAARLHQPYIYICHRGLVDLAVPIVADGQYLGAMMAGQVRLASNEDAEKLERIYFKKTDTSIDAECQRYWDELPEMTFDKIEAIGNMLFHISQTIVQKSLYKIAFGIKEAPQMSQKIVPFSDTSFTELSDPIDPKKPLLAPYTCLRPAFDYLIRNVEDRSTVEDMASLCNISESYFGKCFNKATGMSFNAYQNKLKIQRAEALLKTTEWSVNQIADQLQFESVSYFIRIFKQFLGVTPSVYRKRHLEKALVEHK